MDDEAMSYGGDEYRSWIAQYRGGKEWLAERDEEQRRRLEAMREQWADRADR